MKRLRLLILSTIVLLLGVYACSTITNFLYGPDMTPDELRDALHKDGYAIGGILSDGRTVDQLDDMIDNAEMAKAVKDPSSVTAKLFMDSLRDGRREYAFVWYAVGRVFDAVGIKMLEDAYENIDFDPELFAWFVDAYIEGIKDYMK